VQWHGTAVAETVALTGGKSPKRRLGLMLAAIAVLAAHALGVWYGNSFSVATGSPPRKSTLALEIIRPPKPLPKNRASAAAAAKTPNQGATADPDCRCRSE
jgi:hypothetical protein